VVGVLRCQEGEAGTIEVHPVQVSIIRVAIRLATAGGELDLSIRFVHVLDIAHHPLAPRDLVLQRARGAVV
jgi:hypothetical protein